MMSSEQIHETGPSARTPGSNRMGIAERENMEQMIKMQRDLGMALDRASSLQESLQLCIEAALDVSGLDAGGIYMLDQTTGDLNLISTVGISENFTIRVGKSTAGSERTRMVLTGHPIYFNKKAIEEMRADELIDERISSVAAIPFGNKGRIIGCLNVASRIYHDIPARSRNALESIAVQIGAAVMRAQLEQSLRQSEEKYRAMFENAVEGIFQTTPEGKILSVNPAMAGIFGYETPADFMKNVSNIVQLYAHPADRLSFRRALEAKGTVHKFEVPCVRKDGKEILIAVSARVTRDEEGRVICYDGFYEDYTERKKMENDLRQSEERFRSIVDTSSAGIIVMTIEGRILFANRAMAAMLGYGVEELTGTDYQDYVAQEDRDSVAENIKRLKVEPFNRLYIQRRFICRDGVLRWGYVGGGYIDVDRGHHHVVLVISDITELKKVAEENKRLEDHLRQAQKMEAIGTLAGGIAHDFNNILASMMGFTEMAAKETRKAVRQTYLDEVLQASERAKHLVNQILAFSRQREQESKPMDIRPIVKEALTLLRATLPSTINMKQDITGEQAVVQADPTQMHQIVMNLCANAAQAMTGQSGLLEVRLSNISIDAAGPSPHPDLQPGPYVQLFVRDTGCGIDPAIRDRIFEPFFTTKNAREGTGLGLSVVYGIVKSCGGGIGIQSNAGQGTTFMIYLPRLLLERQSAGENQEDINLRGDERILFVDDEAMLVKMAKNFFQDLGYQITATTSSPEALRLFQENQEKFDLVITDMTMPQLTGADLSRALLKIRPELPIILCTGYSDSISAGEAKKLNIREFVMKPLLLKDLGLRVRRLLDN
jgi:PAS domain S-box-containing protein